MLESFLGWSNSDWVAVFSSTTKTLKQTIIKIYNTYTHFLSLPLTFVIAKTLALLANLLAVSLPSLTIVYTWVGGVSLSRDHNPLINGRGLPNPPLQPHPINSAAQQRQVLLHCSSQWLVLTLAPSCAYRSTRIKKSAMLTLRTTACAWGAAGSGHWDHFYFSSKLSGELLQRASANPKRIY